MIGRNLRAKHIMNVVECEDANENTPISEAGSMTFFFHLSCVARKPVFRVFQTGPTQTGLYNHRSWLEA